MYNLCLVIKKTLEEIVENQEVHRRVGNDVGINMKSASTEDNNA